MRRNSRVLLSRDLLKVRADDLPVTCWCEKEYVAVPRADVLAGRTRTCGARGCQAPTAAGVLG